MFKNTAAKFMVFAWDTTTGVAKTGDAANITCYVSKDYGTVTVLADTSATEMDATNAKGYYLFDAAQGETNGDCLMVSAKSTTANIAVIGAPAVIYTRPTTNWLAPATLNRTLVVDAAGLADANVVKLGPTGSGTAQTARDIGLSVLLASGQKVDVDTIKTNPVVNGGTVTFPTNATLASTTNITAGTIATVTTVTNQLTAAQIATGVWQDTTAGDFTTALSVGKSLMNGVALGTGLTVNAVTGLTASNLDAAVSSRMATYTQPTGFLAATFPSGTVANTTNITAGTITTTTNLTNAPTAGDLTATMKTSVTAAVWDATMASHVTAGTTGAALNAAGGAGDPWITALPGAYASGTAGYIVGTNLNAKVGDVKTKTDQLTFTVANQVDANAASMNATTIKGTGISSDLWRG